MTQMTTCTSVQPIIASHRRPRSMFMNWLRFVQLANHGAASHRAAHDIDTSRAFKNRLLNEIDELNADH